MVPRSPGKVVVASPNHAKGITMTARWRRLRPRDVALFWLVMAIAAIVVLLSASELCACGPRSASSADSEVAPAPLSLTLNAPNICDILHGGGELHGSKRDSLGRPADYSIGWYAGSEIQVSWEVNGGQEPYTLTIDGETRDNIGSFDGATGTGWVSCALEHGEAFWVGDATDEGVIQDGTYLADRYFREEPVVDSGLKQIEATATDANGQTASTSIEVYVVLSRGSTGDLLEAGKTYRIWGELLTIPEGFSLEIGGFEESFGGGPPLYELNVPGGPWVIALEEGTNREVFRRPLSFDAALDAFGDSIDLNQMLDELVASAGVLPIPATTDTP